MSHSIIGAVGVLHLFIWCTPNTPLSYYMTYSNGHHVIASSINNMVKVAVKALQLDQCGFSTEVVSSHSLQVGGAMAMKLNCEDSDTIQKQGRWRSNTFLTYIHSQIVTFSMGIS